MSCYLLQEDGSRFLLEDGSGFLILEDCGPEAPSDLPSGGQARRGRRRRDDLEEELLAVVLGEM